MQGWIFGQRVKSQIRVCDDNEFARISDNALAFDLDHMGTFRQPELRGRAPEKCPINKYLTERVVVTLDMD